MKTTAAVLLMIWWTIPVKAQIDSDLSPSAPPIEALTSETYGRAVDSTQPDQQPAAGPPSTSRHTGIKALIKGLGTDVKHLPSKQNALWVGRAQSQPTCSLPMSPSLGCRRIVIG